MLATCRVERREGRHRADAPSAPARSGRGIGQQNVAYPTHESSGSGAGVRERGPWPRAALQPPTTNRVERPNQYVTVARLRRPGSLAAHHFSMRRPPSRLTTEVAADQAHRRSCWWRCCAFPGPSCSGTRCWRRAFPTCGSLDAWIVPETADVAGALAQAGRITTVGETVTRTVRRGCGSPATLLVADDPATRAGGFSAPQARIAPLPRQTAIIHLLEDRRRARAGRPARPADGLHLAAAR